MSQVSISARSTADHPHSETSSPAGPIAFLDALQILHHRGLRLIHLHGGEPTRHPDFAWMLTRAIERDFSLVVHSNGLLPHSVVRKLERIAPERVNLLVAVVLPGDAWPHELVRQINLFVRLGPRLQLLLSRPDPLARLEQLLDWIDTYQLRRRLRLDWTDSLEALDRRHHERAQQRGILLESPNREDARLDLLPDGKVIVQLA